MNTTTRPEFRSRLPSTKTALLAALIVNTQLLLAILYYGFTDASLSSLTTVRNTVYGLIWLNVAALVFLKVRPPSGYDFATRRRAVAIATAYFGVVLFFGGLISTGVPEHVVDARVAWLPFGYGPAAVVATEWITLVIMPAYLVGYAALAYLVYVTILDASGSVVAGVLGLFSCVSCTWPILAAIASSVLGGGGVLAAGALDASYTLSTAVFLVTVALLSWRPGFR